MALVSTSSASQFDDEEMLKMLVQGDPQVVSRLDGFRARLEEDFAVTAAAAEGNCYWETLTQELNANFNYAATPLQQQAASSSSTASRDGFETESGKQHIQATCALLKLSEDRAIQVTLGAVQKLYNGESQLPGLLGTKDLLIKTTLYHFQQRLARLQLLTECLRIEQDAENQLNQDLTGCLDSLDSAFQDQSRYRGLFRNLLTTACMPFALPTREQLAPSYALSKSTRARTLQDSFSATNISTSTTTNEAFNKTMLEETRSQTLCERTQAMEALLVLFYHRINGGVCRNDFCLMLQAFQDSGIFHGEDNRLARLAGLICAESMQLWRAFDMEEDPRVGWATKHPLLLGIVSSGDNHTQFELEALKAVMLDSMNNNGVENSHGPQALALLSFGLLLRLGHDSLAGSDAGTDSQAYWRTFAASGMELARLANEWAFEYLYDSVKDLCGNNSNTSSFLAAKKSSAGHDHFYDWQLANTLNNPLLLGAGEEGDEPAADVAAYTSIAREVLTASVAAFPSILSFDTNTNNIEILCNLAAAIYQCNPLLAEEFWNSWQSFIAPNPPSVPLPMCSLMEASHRLATSALEAYNQQQMNNNMFVPAVAPFFRLLASLCHSSDIVQVTIGILPPGMVRTTLLACRLPTGVTGSDEYNQGRLFILDALAALAKAGNNSRDCLESLRLSFEDLQQENHVIVDGPRVFGRILYSTTETAVTEPVLRLMAHLLDGAPQRWALELARQFISSHEHQSILNTFLAPGMETTHAAALVLAELIEHMTAVVFCKSFNDNDAVVFLRVLAEGILACGAALVPSLSTSSSSIGQAPVAFETAQTLLQLFTNFLKLIRTVIELHESARVSTAAVDVRDSLINTLATSAGLGEAIAFFATAPVSLTLAAQLSDALVDGHLEPSLKDEDADNRKKYGAWQSVLSNQSYLSTTDSLLKKLLMDSVSEIGVNNFDLEGIQQRGWTGAGDSLAPLNAAWSAIRLLSMWALHVEDIVKSHVNDSGAPLEGVSKELIDRLSPQGLLSSLAPSPVPCRQNSSLSTVWQSAGLSNFEMLLPFVSSIDENSPLSAAVPASVTLDFLHTCLVHVKVCGVESVADTMLFHGVYRSARFPKLLVESIERAVTISAKSELGPYDKTEIINGLLSFRLMSTCVEASPTVADRMLQLESNSIVPTLIKVASSARDLLGIGTGGSQEIFKDESSIVKMRLASGAISVLAALWTTARSVLPGQNGSVCSRLVKAVEDRTSFITDLMTTVMGYANANDIESQIVTSRESEYARCTLTTFMSKSLDILATEVAYFVCNRDNANSTLESLLLKTFFQPQRFTSFNGYKYAAESSAQFASMEVKGVGNQFQPICLLQCFPTSASRLLSQDFYTMENSFDVGSSAHWLCDNSGTDESETEDIMARVSIAYQLASCDLNMIASWKGFAEVLVYFSVDHARLSGNRDAGPSSERLLNLAQDTLRALHFNIEAINQAQVEVAVDFMRGKSSRMAIFLTELFLFFLEMGSQNEESSKLVDCDELIDLLDLLTKTSEMLFTVMSSLPANASSVKDFEICCKLERSLLASAILVDSLIEAKGSLSKDQQRREKGIFNSLCRVGGKVLKVLGDVIKHTNKAEAGNRAKEKDNRLSLSCCISLFTVLVAKGQGSQMTDASYFKLISESLKEYDVLKQLIAYGMAAATAAAAAIAGSRDLEYPKRGPSVEETANLNIVHSVLNLSYSVAEAHNPEMLSIFIGTQLSQLVTRNPLYQYAGRVWTQQSGGTKPPRGYVLSFKSEPIAPGSLQICKTDPVHTIWLTSMKVLQASLRSSTNCLNIQGTESIGKLFFGMSVEFLHIHRDPIISCLKYCGSKLTRNGLEEATQILALTAELCKRDNRDVFVHEHGQICEELVSWSNFVFVSVSKFVGASGTARELFQGLEEYDSSDPDYVDNVNYGSVPSKARHPLLSGRRLQDAKHEAYKFSHYAARCCERVTKMDFEAGSTVPAQLRYLSLDRKNDEALEQACRLSVTCDFALEMEKAAADCLSQALSAIWRTHPVSRSFKMFSEREAVQLDTMSLVQPGLVIGFRPAGGAGILADGGGDTFEKLRFGKVCSSDTISRTWTVKILGRQDGNGFGGDTTEVVRTRQLAGIEDTSMRKAVAAYLPGPDTMDALEKGCVSLSLGHLILVLRWCHQRFLSLKESSLPEGLAKMKTTARIAEQTVALLGAELAIHDEIESALNMEKAERSQLDSQIYEMFADPEILRPLDPNAMATSVQMQEGRMKDVIEDSIWDSVRPQVSREVERTWKEMKEKEQTRQKRAYGETNWFSGGLGRSRGHKSAFRG